MTWADAKNLPIAFVDNLHIQLVDGRLYLTFGQVNLPLFDGAPPEKLQVELRPVFRCAITPEDFKRITAAMHGVAEKLDRQLQEMKG